MAKTKKPSIITFENEPDKTPARHIVFARQGMIHFFDAEETLNAPLVISPDGETFYDCNLEYSDAVADPLDFRPVEIAGISVRFI